MERLLLATNQQLAKPAVRMTPSIPSREEAVKGSDINPFIREIIGMISDEGVGIMIAKIRKDQDRKGFKGMALWIGYIHREDFGI